MAAVEPGDLLFFARPSLIQRWSAAVDDDFRGIAIADRLDGRLVMLQCGHPKGFECRDVAEIVDDFDIIGIGRAPTCHCVDDVLQWARQRLPEANHYPLASLLPAFLLSWARNAQTSRLALLRLMLIGGPITVVGMLLSVGARLRSRRSWTFICSTFVVEALERGCTRHQPVTAMGRTKTDDPAEPSCLDGLFRRWYLTPSDLWRSLPNSHRFLLDVDLRAGSGDTGSDRRVQTTDRAVR